MIYDRTKQDVDNAQAIFETKVKAFVSLTDEEKNIMERGRVTTNTLNRIETAQEAIGEMLVTMGYLNVPIVNKTWLNSDVFFEEDLYRIVNNTKALRKSFFVLSQNLKDPIPAFDYTNFNIIEKLLYEMSELIEIVKSNYKRADAYIAGQGINLPLKGVG